jgi:hypothetical protein
MNSGHLFLRFLLLALATASAAGDVARASTHETAVRITRLFLDGKGNGILQLETPRDSGIYSWDWLWFDGRKIHVLEGSVTGPESYAFRDRRFSTTTMAFDSSALSYRCVGASGAGKGFRFTAASDEEITRLQSRLDAGTLAVTYLPETRRLEWVLRDWFGKYYVTDVLEKGPPSAPSESFFVGRKKNLQPRNATRVAAMCGVDHRIEFSDGARIRIFRPESSAGCQSIGPIEAVWEKPGFWWKRNLEVVDPSAITPEELGLPTSLYRTNHVTHTPCDLAA